MKPGSVKAAFLLMLTMLLTAAGIAQVRISGKVTAKGGAAAEAASVVIRENSVGAATDATGAFSFTAALKPGTYTIVFSSAGYRTQQSSLTVTAGNNSYTVNAELAEDVSKLDEVIVTGNSQGTTRRQLGSYISSVSAEDLNKGATGCLLYTSPSPRD